MNEPTGIPNDRAHPPSPAALGVWGPEAWISIGIGLILLFAYPHFSQWLVDAALHKPLPFSISDGSGADVPYLKSDFFLSDLCIALFAYALIIEGTALLLTRRPAAILLVFALTCAAVALNAFYVIDSFSSGQGLALMSAVAVLVGGYMAMYQWRLFQEIKRLGDATGVHAK